MVYYFIEFTATRLGEHNLWSSIMRKNASQMLLKDTIGYEEETSAHHSMCSARAHKRLLGDARRLC